MDAVKKFDQWHKTRKGYVIMGILELVLAYIVGSRAIDTGSWWEYGLTVLLLVGGAQNLYHAIRKK